MTPVFLTGMMGSGKSAVGQALATRLGRAFVDLDREIERAAGASIAELFEREGELGFRACEAASLHRLLERDSAANGAPVVALGGGALEGPAGIDAVIPCGRLVYLRARPQTLLSRLARPEIARRPLLAGAASPREALAVLLDRREPTYARAHLSVDTDDLSVEAVTDLLAARVASTGAVVTVSLGRRSYPVLIGSGLLPHLGTLVARYALPSGGPSRARAGVVTDDEVRPRFGERVVQALSAAGFSPVLVELSAGEANKTLAAVSRIYDALLDAPIDRSSPVVAVGGGVVGDVAGFAAATLLRGVPLVQVPTTLLAQVDASVGGKTGVNHARGKNLVGAFHQPRLVVADVDTLASLSPRDYTAGFGEIVKCGLLGDPALLGLLEGASSRIRSRDPDLLAECVRRCIALKARVVAGDEREESTGDPPGRAALNLGHTFAHALEAVTGYAALRHGEAVAIGLCLAARLSAALGLCDATLPARVEALCTALGLPIQAPPASRDAVLSAMAADKKVRGGVLHLILLERPGSVRHLAVPEEQISAILSGGVR